MKKHLLLIAVCFNLFVFSQNDRKKVSDSVFSLISLSKDENHASNFEGALKYATLAVKHAQKSDSAIIKGKAYICLANTYQMVSDSINTKKYFNSALEIGENINSPFLKGASYNGLGNVYSRNKNSVDTAASYFEKSLEYLTEDNNYRHIFVTYYNIASMYIDYNEPDKAYPYLLKAREYYMKLEEKTPLFSALLNMYYANYYLQKKDENNAITYINKALGTAEKNKLHLDLIDIYDLKSRIHQQNKDYDAAIESIRKKQHYKDLNYNTEKAQQIEKIKADLEVSEYEEAVKASETKIITTILFASISLLIIICLFWIFYLNKKRSTVAILEKKNKALQESKIEAERVNKLKSDLLVNLSHELRTPLYGITGITSVLMEESEENGKQKELLNSLKFSGEYLKNLVNNILRNEEIEANNITITKKPVNIRQLIIDIVSLFMVQAKENQNKLMLNIDQAIGTQYDIDDDKLSEILVNLLSNAIKFTNDGTIELNAELLEKNDNTDTIVFTIKDTGEGIPKDKLEAIFESFKQVQTNTNYGAGLGLSIAKNLVEILGGKMQVKSELNKGSEFSFTLSLENKISNKINTVDLNKTLDVLIVEDNRINQIVSKKLITSLGHMCTIAKNGLEGVEICKKQDFDIIFMDINMPVMNGLEATKAIKEFKPESKIIALTALEISEIKSECDKVGIDDIINKPISKEQLDVIIMLNLNMI